MASATLCAVGHVALWLTEGDRDCGCLGSVSASHSMMPAGSTAVALATWWGRPSNSVTIRTRTIGSCSALALALFAVLAVRGQTRAMPSRDWYSAVAHAVSDGDVILFGSSSCGVCAAIHDRRRLDVGEREVRLDSVILVHRVGDHAHAQASHPYKRVMQIDSESWWAAVGTAAPAAYVVDGDRVRRVETAPGHPPPAAGD